MTVQQEPVQYGNTRAYVNDEGIYLIRDMRRGIYGRIICQYAIRVSGTNNLSWLECDEGVEFSKISPFFLFPKNTDAIPAHNRPMRVGDPRSHEDIHD